MMPANDNLRRVAGPIVGLASLYIVLFLSATHVLIDVDVMSLPMHMAMETFSIVIAMLVFGVAWNAYSTERPGNILLLACGFLAVGLLDFAHTLSFNGMPDFVTPGSEEKAIQFWMAARFVSALTLLVVALRSWEPLSRPRARYIMLVSSITVVVLTYWLVLFHGQSLPHTYVEGVGLTLFKVRGELIIIFMMLAAAILFYRQVCSSPPSDQATPASLFAASVVTILSEMCFVLYLDADDLFSLLGHLYKVIAYSYIYQAVFVGSVREPFLRLQESRDELYASRMMLRSILDSVPARIFWKDRGGRYLGANDLFLRDVGLKNESELVGRTDFDIFEDHAELYVTDDQIVMASGVPKLDFDEPLTMADGRAAYLITSKVPLFAPDGTVSGVLGTYIDNTERKLLEKQLTLMDVALNKVHESAFLYDQDTLEFIYVNDEACRATGYSREELLQMTVLDVDPDASLKSSAALRSLKKAGGSIVLERRLKTKDGEILPVEVHTSLFEYQDMEISFSFTRNIAERKRMEKSEAIRLKIFERLAQGGDLLEILGLVTSYIGEALPGYFAGIKLVDPDMGSLQPVVMPDFPGSVSMRNGRLATLCSVAEQHLHATGAEDAATHPFMGTCRNFFERGKRLSCYSEPILGSSRELLGTFCIYRGEAAVPSERERELLRRASHFAAIAIERKRAERLLMESHAQLRGMAARREAVREEERRYIAREVHDELGQILTGLQLNASVLMHKFSEDSAELSSRLREIVTLTEKAVDVARNIASALRPPALDMGIASALEWLADRFSVNAGIRAEVAIEDKDISLEENQAIALFRIVQESLTNVTRYAEASRVGIVLSREGSEYVLKVQDDGIGFDLHSIKENSFGLVGMRERALMLWGSLSICSRPGEGTEVEVRIPADNLWGKHD
ncbi:MAG: PAS domain S-box protein [Sideroxydans sp.]|nr:PAS domain S-box protein [Sideroxydans sp.]